MRDLAREYEENVGHPPPKAPEEERWQWEYTGKPAERDRLVELVGAKDLRAEQQTLF